MEKNNYSEKSLFVAVLLCIFFGMFGIHRMYVGKIGTGVVYLLLTITGFGAIITLLAVVCDIISMIAGTFTDKLNLKLK